MCKGRSAGETVIKKREKKNVSVSSAVQLSEFRPQPLCVTRKKKNEIGVREL